MAEKLTMLKVGGIHCEGCGGNIERALRSIQGVKELRVDIKHVRVTVRYDTDSANQEVFKDAIRKIGYRVP